VWKRNLWTIEHLSAISTLFGVQSRAQKPVQSKPKAGAALEVSGLKAGASGFCVSCLGCLVGLERHHSSARSGRRIALLEGRRCAAVKAPAVHQPAPRGSSTGPVCPTLKLSQLNGPGIVATNHGVAEQAVGRRSPISAPSVAIRTGSRLHGLHPVITP